MKSFTRLANAITKTPTRPGNKDKSSERQQGDSKRGKTGSHNYYKAFNNMFHVADPEVTEVEDKKITEILINNDVGAGNGAGVVQALRSNGEREEDTATPNQAIDNADKQIIVDLQQDQHVQTRAGRRKIW